MNRRGNWQRYAVATWSGGIDSTAVIGHLLRRGFEVEPYNLLISRKGIQAVRESAAISRIEKHFAKLCDSGEWPGLLHQTTFVDGQWLWNFSPDGVEIPRRNKHIIDHMITARMMPEGIVNLAVGEYSGVDTWLVQDHVQGADCDSRALAGYVWQEWGQEFRLWTLDDFGEARFKSDRVRLLLEVLPEPMIFDTTCCLYDEPIHCGRCYKCVERHAAFSEVLGHDGTVYDGSPALDPRFAKYMDQFYGNLPGAESYYPGS